MVGGTEGLKAWHGFTINQSILPHQQEQMEHGNRLTLLWVRRTSSSPIFNVNLSDPRVAPNCYKHTWGEHVWLSFPARRYAIRKEIFNYGGGKGTTGIPDLDLNLDLTVIGSLVYCESSALDHAASEASPTFSLGWAKPMGTRLSLKCSRSVISSGLFLRQNKKVFVWNTPVMWFGKVIFNMGQTNANQTLSGTFWVCGLVWFSLGQSKPIRNKLCPEHSVVIVCYGSFWDSPNQHEPGFVWKPLELSDSSTPLFSFEMTVVIEQNLKNERHPQKKILDEQQMSHVNDSPYTDSYHPTDEIWIYDCNAELW
uniref:Uncharacterized protein n=1 Tax=Timema monikensis TaxID=170555 RepID=A0A7R9E458_9NEOP|nr:unnamed protein product [Timema monikensis]